MKLLLCKDCHDIFNLRLAMKTCSCGKTSGQYINNLDAEYSGPGIPLGFTNISFRSAVLNQPKGYHDMGKEFVAFVIAEECPTIKKLD